MTRPAIAIVGAGRVGLTLGRALSREGHHVTMLTRDTVDAPDGMLSTTDWDDALAHAALVLLAVTDTAVTPAAEGLAARGVLAAHHVVMHTSGMMGRTSLASLDACGAALGSWHPLMTFTRAEGEPDLLRGTPAVLEGDARAVAMARQFADELGMAPVIELTEQAKPRYHAGAVFSANYLVVLADIARRLATDAGAGDHAASLYLPLMRRALENIAERGTVAALTGPVARGDADMVAAHLDALDPDTRASYVALGHAALRVAREQGLDAALADGVAAALGRVPERG